MNDTASATERNTILVVDDSPENLTLMGDLLMTDYKIKVANSGEKALRIARSGSPPTLILLDIMMPGIDGYEVCRQLKGDEKTADIPVIFLTALTEIEDEKRGLELGAVDYITKPISPPILLARVRNHLALKSYADFLRDKNVYLENEVEKRKDEVRMVQEATILALASLAESRDNDTGNHLRRTQLYVKSLALKLKTHPRFREYLTDYHIGMLYKSAPLHDIGKVGIPDHILLKPGPLEPEEFEIMKTHATIGRDAIQRAEQHLDHEKFEPEEFEIMKAHTTIGHDAIKGLGTHFGVNVKFLEIAQEVALSHHEKWDGTGYPEELSGDDIPISARLMAVADVYDALISRRVYRQGMPHEKVAQIIIEGRGLHFDPNIVDAFVEVQVDFQEIANRYTDPDPA